MDGTNWTCSFCNRPQTLTKSQKYTTHEHLYLGNNKHGDVGVTVTAVTCANPECGEVDLSAFFTSDVSRSTPSGHSWSSKGIIDVYRLRPSGISKPQPSCVPTVIAEDYYEACSIRDLSPKASATLLRRCLQGMIRDFCGVSKKRLIDEITALRDAVISGKGPIGVLPDTIEAIDHVRSIGNIGAHMEQDVNVIIPVEPHEAQALIDLIEILFEEWYVARESRKQKLERVKTIGAEKQALKSVKPTTP